MRERIRFEQEVAELGGEGPPELKPGISTGKLSVHGASASHPQSVNFNIAKNVMWEVIRILNRQHDEKTADPDRSTTTATWYRGHKDLLREWYLLTYGEPRGAKRERLTGEALSAKLEAALAKTGPVLEVVKARGGKKWTKQLGELFYPRVADLEYEAVETKPKPAPPARIPPVEFPSRPKAVSLEEFFSEAATWESRPIDINLGEGRFSLGSYTTGSVFSASQQDQRVLLWSSGSAVFFMRDGTIFAQNGLSFSQDIIMGAFIVAAQNAAGIAILAKLMVEVALSFTPWGILADGGFALEALTTRGSWKEAALTILPGPAIGLASKTKTVRAAARGVAVAGTVAKEVVKGAVRFIGRGVYRLKGKRLRGLWIVGESAGKNSFRFFDDAGKRWIEVSDATRYIKCSRCQFTRTGRGDAFEGAVDEIMDGLAQSPVYSSRGRVLVNRQLIKDVVEAYGPWGDHVVEMITNTWMSAKRAAVKSVDDTLMVAKSLSAIQDANGYKHAIDIFEDLASSSERTARGTMFELRWSAAHAADIQAIGIPVARKNGWRGKGLDVLKKNGEAVELKNFDFASEFYRLDPGRSVARIVKQVESRLKYKDVTKVTVIFSSEAGKMPAEFGRQLTSAMIDLAKRTGRKSSDITFRFWP